MWKVWDRQHILLIPSVTKSSDSTETLQILIRLQQSDCFSSSQIAAPVSGIPTCGISLENVQFHYKLGMHYKNEHWSIIVV